MGRKKKHKFLVKSPQVNMCLNTPITTSNQISQNTAQTTFNVSEAIKGCENLSHWISRLKAKEAILKNNRESDLRKEVLLSKATRCAQQQLEQQQRLNRQRWTEVKAKELEKCNLCLALKRFCSCSNTTIYMEILMKIAMKSRKILTNFFESLNSDPRKRRQPSILQKNN